MQLIADIHAKEDVAQHTAQFPSCDVDLSALMHRLQRLAQPQSAPVAPVRPPGSRSGEKTVGIWSRRATIPRFTFQAGRPNLRRFVAA